MSSLPDAEKASFVLHFLLAAWGTQGYWHPDSYFFYNLIFLMTFLWTISNKDSTDPPQLCLFLNICAIFLDVTVISIYFPTSRLGSADRFSAVMAVLNLVFRPVSSYVLYRNWKRRTEGTEPTENQGYASM